MCSIEVDGNSCGLGGTCFRGICECRPGWFKIREFAFATDASLTDPFLCDSSKPGLIVLYTLLLTHALFALVIYGKSVKKKSQAKRLIPYWIIISTLAALSILKLTSIEFAIGVDFASTFFFAVSMFLLNLCLQVYLNKYIRYHYKTFKIKNPKSLKKIELIRKVGYFIIGLQTVMVLAFLLVSLIEVISPTDFEKLLDGARGELMKERAKKSLMKIGLGIACFSYLYQLIVQTTLIWASRKDVLSLKRVKKEFLDKTLAAMRILLIPTVLTNMTNGILLFIALVSDSG